MTNINQVKFIYDEMDSKSINKTIDPIPLSTFLNSEANLSLILKVILDLLAEARTLYDLEEDVICRYEFFDEKGELIEHEDYVSFFTAICEASLRFQSLHKNLLSFVEKTYNQESEERFWEDDESPAGEFIVSSLATKNKKYIKNYIDFLRTCDMDHEVNQYGYIRNIVKKHGVCEETLLLAIARACSACGQHGAEQFNELLEQGFLEYIKSNFDFFIKKLEEEHTFKEIWFLDEDYEEFWDPGDMYPSWIDTVLEVLDESQKEKFRLFFKERL